MRTIIVTGGAGFIGANLVRYLLAETDARVVVLDKLTYAGNLQSLKDLEGDPRLAFAEADIADGRAVRGLLRQHRPGAIMNLAAESHVDRSIDSPADFIATNLVGTYELLEATREYYQGAGRPRLPPAPHLHRRGLRLPRAGGALRGGDALRAQLPLRGHQGRRRPSRASLSPHLRAAGAADQLLEQLRAVPVPREADPAGGAQRPRGQTSSDLRRRRQRPRLAVRHGSLCGAAASARDRPCRRALQRRRRRRAHQPGGGREICAALERATPRRENESLAKAGVASYAELKSFVKDRPGHDVRYAIDASKLRAELGWRTSVEISRRPGPDRRLVPGAPRVVRGRPVGQLPAGTVGAPGSLRGGPQK